MLRYCLILLAAVASGCKMFVPIVQEGKGKPKPVGVAESASAVVLAEHIELQYDHYVFDIEVINKLDIPIYFNPSEIFYFAANTRFDPVDAEVIDVSWQHSGTHPPLTRARSHDDVLDIIEAEYVYTREVLGLGSGNESWQASLTNDAAKALENLEYLPSEFFPSGLINKRSSRRGKIFVPMTEVPFKYIRLVIPVGQFDYIIDLKRRGAAGYDQPVGWLSYAPRAR